MGWESGNIAFKFLGAYMAGCVCGSHFVHIYMAVLGVTVAVHLLFFSYFASDEDIGADSVYDTYHFNIERLLLHNP